VPVSCRQDFLPLSRRSDIRCARLAEENPKIDPNAAATFHAAAISGAPAWPLIGLPGGAAG
jgi:hypothetical protein